ncbi:MAG: glycosyltransferase family 1 protein [bacterium]|nr:glycosyltransferase family 1 protein [bacterium]
MSGKIKIGIDARITDGKQGGVQQFIIGLAQGLSQLTDGDETYIFLAYQGQSDWLKPYIGGKCQLHLIDDMPKMPIWKQYLKRFTKLRYLWHLIRAKRNTIKIPHSDGLIENLHIDLMHFTTQNGFLTAIPTIYHPWDLQHIHLPQFFTPLERQHRDMRYRAFCDQAKLVAAASTWIKNDLIAHYHLNPEKISVIPMASVLVGYPQPSPDELQAIAKKYDLPAMFAYYPAQTWEHKNHIRLLEALVILRDVHHITIPLVLSGTINAYGHTIQKYIHRMGLDKQVLMLGYVSTLEVQALYRLCTMMIFPSRFEGWGLPLTEAMSAGVPVACSNITHLPDIVADAGLVFDPDDSEAMADVMLKLWQNPTLREDLITKGHARASAFSWEITARLFRAHYRQLLGVPLSQDEEMLLVHPPLV